MPFDLNNKVVIAIASSALFDLSESQKVFSEKGVDEYRKFQIVNENNPYPEGTAFNFIKRLLLLNNDIIDNPIEVLLISKNDPDTGLRVLNSIEHYGLNISRAVFRSGKSLGSYIKAFKSKIFLSANEEDVINAIEDGLPAGRILASQYSEDINEKELRIGFDFDGVIADDSSERIFQKKGLNEYLNHENKTANIPINPGPLKPLLEALSKLQQLELKRQKQDNDYIPILRTALITARNAPAHKKVIYTLRNWRIRIDEAFFLGGIQKDIILNEWKPHIYFDDQLPIIENTSHICPSVHIPFGAINQRIES